MGTMPGILDGGVADRCYRPSVMSAHYVGSAGGQFDAVRD